MALGQARWQRAVNNAEGDVPWSAGIVAVRWTFGQAAEHWLRAAARATRLVVLALSVLFDEGADQRG